MIRIAVLGDVGSGKSYVAKQFGYPVFNADVEVAKLYRKSRKCHKKLKKALPKYIVTFPIKKIEISKAIMGGQHNLKKIVKIGFDHGLYQFKRWTSAKYYNDFDIYFVSSEQQVKLAKKRGITTTKAIGYPKLDPAFDGTYDKRFRENLIEKLNNYNIPLSEFAEKILLSDNNCFVFVFVWYKNVGSSV